ncbi:TrmH family RNA methyltransferase [Motilibacter aurantiacus]|uniref:TrmH family RNA methyltransferase n=1 Tax=Motilibacter aurantiacus TaxID=2714955 RepID=UPI002F2B3182
MTSARSPRVAAARRLAKRSFRSADRRFLAEGPQAVREALACTPDRVLEVLVTDELAGRLPELVGLARDARVPVMRVTADVLASVAQTVTPQGVLAVCGFVDVPLEQALSAGARLVAVLANVRDPGNAGTVLRAADAAGADAVVLTDASVDVYNGKCVRATAGSLFHLPVVAGAPAAAAFDALRAAGLRVVAADGKGRDLDLADRDGDLAGPTAWVFGNEAWGLPDALLDMSDDVLAVPIHGRAESLNLATAAAVCLYASARAQRALPAPPSGH